LLWLIVVVGESVAVCVVLFGVVVYAVFALVIGCSFMKCIYETASTPYPCGRCTFCLVNRRRKWTSRIMFEALYHEHSSFLTATYDDKHLPPDGSLVPADFQLFLKRFRDRVSPLRFRFYACGEYGESSFRPHYHAVLFGISPDFRREAFKCWGLCRYERFTLTPLTPERAQYVCGYVTKKMTKKDDPRLAGRHPEFARMSLRPGIGAQYMDILGSKLLTNQYSSDFIEREGRVPAFLKNGGRVLPIDRYLRSRLENALGFDQSMCGKLRRQKISEEKFREELRAVSHDSSLLAAFLKERISAFSPEEKAQKLANLKSRLSVTRKLKI